MSQPRGVQCISYIYSATPTPRVPSTPKRKIYPDCHNLSSPFSFIFSSFLSHSYFLAPFIRIPTIRARSAASFFLLLAYKLESNNSGFSEFPIEKPSHVQQFSIFLNFFIRHCLSRGFLDFMHFVYYRGKIMRQIKSFLFFADWFFYSNRKEIEFRLLQKDR